jgi:hypothetical protein
MPRRVIRVRLAASAALAAALLATPAGAKEDCEALLAQAKETYGADSAMMAEVRGKIAEAEALCAEGKTEEGVKLLKKILAENMPMGLGN